MAKINILEFQYRSFLQPGHVTRFQDYSIIIVFLYISFDVYI